MSVHLIEELISPQYKLFVERSVEERLKDKKILGPRKQTILKKFLLLFFIPCFLYILQEFLGFFEAICFEYRIYNYYCFTIT